MPKDNDQSTCYWMVVIVVTAVYSGNYKYTSLTDVIVVNFTLPNADNTTTSTIRQGNFFWITDTVCCGSQTKIECDGLIRNRVKDKHLKPRDSKETAPPTMKPAYANIPPANIDYPASIWIVRMSSFSALFGLVTAICCLVASFLVNLKTNKRCIVVGTTVVILSYILQCDTIIFYTMLIGPTMGFSWANITAAAITSCSLCALYSLICIGLYLKFAYEAFSLKETYDEYNVVDV